MISYNVHCFFGSLKNVIGCGKVWLASAKPNHWTTSGFERFGFAIDSQGC
jgi:hypothetical protein